LKNKKIPITDPIHLLDSKQINTAKRKSIAIKDGFSISKNYWKLYFSFLEAPRTKYAFESVNQ
jgi:hypothetical protein